MEDGIRFATEIVLDKSVSSMVRLQIKVRKKIAHHIEYNYEDDKSISELMNQIVHETHLASKITLDKTVLCVPSSYERVKQKFGFHLTINYDDVIRISKLTNGMVDETC